MRFFCALSGLSLDKFTLSFSPLSEIWMSTFCVNTLIELIRHRKIVPKCWHPVTREKMRARIYCGHRENSFSKQITFKRALK